MIRQVGVPFQSLHLKKRVHGRAIAHRPIEGACKIIPDRCSGIMLLSDRTETADEIQEGALSNQRGGSANSVTPSSFPAVLPHSIADDNDQRSYTQRSLRDTNTSSSSLQPPKKNTNFQLSLTTPFGLRFWSSLLVHCLYLLPTRSRLIHFAVYSPYTQNEAYRHPSRHGSHCTSCWCSGSVCSSHNPQPSPAPALNRSDKLQKAEARLSFTRL